MPHDMHKSFAENLCLFPDDWLALVHIDVRQVMPYIDMLAFMHLSSLTLRLCALWR